METPVVSFLSAPRLPQHIYEQLFLRHGCSRPSCDLCSWQRCISGVSSLRRLLLKLERDVGDLLRKQPWLYSALRQCQQSLVELSLVFIDFVHMLQLQFFQFTKQICWCCKKKAANLVPGYGFSQLPPWKKNTSPCVRNHLLQNLADSVRGFRWWMGGS